MNEVKESLMVQIQLEKKLRALGTWLNKELVLAVRDRLSTNSTIKATCGKPWGTKERVLV